MKTLSEEIISRIKEMNTILSQSGITSKQEPEAGEEILFHSKQRDPCNQEMGGPNGGGYYNSCIGLCCSGPCPCTGQ